jgi:hypothetical protein
MQRRYEVHADERHGHIVVATDEREIACRIARNYERQGLVC